MEFNRIIQGDALSVLKTLPDSCVDCCVTSPPYYALRDYGVEGQLGLEETPDEFIARLADVFSEVYRVMKPSGTLWVNMGDSYAGSMKGAAGYPDNAMNYKQGTNRGLLGKATCIKKIPGFKPKDLIGIPWMLAFELRRRGWYLRQDIIWQKTNCMPESVKDRCTKSHEYIFLLSKSSRYYFDYGSVKTISKERKSKAAQFVGGKKRSALITTPGDPNYRKSTRREYVPSGKARLRSVWTMGTNRKRLSHAAAFPEELVVKCILAGCPEGGIVLDPFIGSGTTGAVARKYNRNYVGIELNPNYIKEAICRISENENLFNQ